MLFKKSSNTSVADAATGAQTKRFSRRNFLGYAGGASALLLGAAACQRERPGTMTNEGGVDLGSGDTGILNYAYLLEQIEAAFYKQVYDTPFTGITATERLWLCNIKDHEIAHREFFKKALGDAAIPSVELNFSSIDFSSRDSVLGTAKAFEDLGVSAYNGAGQLITSPDYLVLAGKIVSVEARHAAYIRDLIMNGSFADNSVIDANGLDMSRTPMQVLTIAGPYVKTKINASNLPTN